MYTFRSLAASDGSVRSLAPWHCRSAPDSVQSQSAPSPRAHDGDIAVADGRRRDRCGHTRRQRRPAHHDNPIRQRRRRRGHTAQTDPLYDATHATTGGGTGPVVIGPFVRPGTVACSNESWLPTMEDLVAVRPTRGRVSTERGTAATPRNRTSPRSGAMSSPVRPARTVAGGRYGNDRLTMDQARPPDAALAGRALAGVASAGRFRVGNRRRTQPRSASCTQARRTRSSASKALWPSSTWVDRAPG